MKRFFKIVVIIMGVAVLSCSGVYASDWKEGVVRIGGMFGMTGAFADVGKYQNMGFSDRIKYQNEELGGIQGHKIEYLWADMKTDVPTAIRIYERWSALKPKPIMINVGHSTALHQLIKDFNKDQIVSVTTSSNVPQIVPPGYLFWSLPGYSDIVVAFGMWLKETWDYSKGMPKVAFLRWDHPSGVAIAEYAGAYCEKQGYFKAVADEIVPIGAVDATSHLVKISKVKPDFAYTNLLGTTPIAIKQADKMGILKDTKFVLNIYDIGKAYVEAAGELGNGLLGLMPVATMGDMDLPGIAKIAEVHGKYHGKEEIEDNFSYISSWVAGDITIAAANRVVEKHGYKNLSGKAVKEALEEMKDFDTGKITYPISYGKGSEGRRGNKHARVIQYNFAQKVWKPVSKWYEVPFVVEGGKEFGK